EVTCIPLSALRGDNVVRSSAAMPWHEGPVLLEHLESVRTGQERPPRAGFRLPVQWVCRPDQDFRGFAGTVASGPASPGDAVVVLPSGRRSRIERILTADVDLASAFPGQAVILTLADEVDASRGDLIAAVGQPPEVADQFAAHVLWLADQPMLPGRGYWMRIGSTT